MAQIAFGQLVGDVRVANLKDLMNKSFVVKKVEYAERGDYEQLILTVEVDGKVEQYGTFSDSIKQKTRRFIEPAILAGNTVEVKLTEVETSNHRKAMVFADPSSE